jgi:RNA polymerase sigma-70 factor, ECF subfamily
MYNDCPAQSTYGKIWKSVGFSGIRIRRTFPRFVASLECRTYLAMETPATCSHFPNVEPTVTDTDLLERVRDSDMEAFRMLFERYQPIVFRHTLYRTGQIDLSHDVVQETFTKVWERRQSLKPRLSFLAYALRISVNLVRDAAKHRKVRERLQSFVPPPVLSEGDDPAEVFQVIALQERISAVINQDLTERCRQIFLLSRFEEKPHKEIAEMLGISVRTVEHQISHALKVLRKKLGSYLS